MRHYWIRIALGALGVFAVGMVVVAIIRRIATTVKTVAESSDPITIPLAFVPFRLDGDRLGTFDRAVLIRKSPKKVTALDLGVKLGDSASVNRLEDCVLLAKFATKSAGGGAEFSDADFACLQPDSAVALGARPFGHVSFEPGGRTVALFVPAEVATHFRREMIGSDAGDTADSIADAAARMADSISDAASQTADSIAAFHEHQADSARDLALRRADSVRRAAARLRDSIRASLHRP
jgi:hypothetical protein